MTMTGARAITIRMWQDGIPEVKSVVRPGDVVTAVVKLKIPRRRWGRWAHDLLEHRVHFVVESIDG